MNTATAQDVQKYLKTGNGWMVGTILCAVLALVYLPMLPFLSVLCLAIGALCFWRRTVVKRKLREQLEGLDGSAEQSRILQDFAHAQSVIGDTLRVGQHYLYGKGSGRVVAYSEIKQVYQHIQRTNFVETARTLQYVNTDGKTRVLCRLPLRDKAKDEVLQVMAFILSKNPNVKLGYR